MSLLKVSLCINRPKQRLLCMDIRSGCRSKRSPTPWKNKTFFFSQYGGPFCSFFSMGSALCYVFLLMKGFFHCLEAFLLVSLYVGGGGPFCCVFLLVWGLFHNVGAFLLVFLYLGRLLSLWFFLWACSFPL